MSEKQVRADVEKALRQRVDDRVWQLLVFSGDVRDADHLGNIDELVKLVRQFSRAPRRSHRSGTFQLPTVAAGSARLRGRALALSQLIADEAAQDPLVIDYRLRHLGGRVLAFAAAQALMDSPAACRVPATVLTAHRVALIGHTSRIVRTKQVGCDWCWADDRAWVDYEIDVAGTTTQVTAIDAPSHRRLLAYQSAGRPRLVAGVGNGSPLEELLDLANALAGAYRWRSSEAAAVVLEGSVPFVPPIEVTRSFHVAPSGRTQATITLAVDPSVPAAAVARAYGDAQDLTLWKPPKATDARTMAALAFVTERRRDQPDLSGSDLMSSFNRFWVAEAEGEVETFDSTRVFQQAVGRGARNVRGLVKLPPQAHALLRSSVETGARGRKHVGFSVPHGSPRPGGPRNVQPINEHLD